MKMFKLHISSKWHSLVVIDRGDIPTRPESSPVGLSNHVLSSPPMILMSSSTTSIAYID